VTQTILPTAVVTKRSAPPAARLASGAAVVVLAIGGWFLLTPDDGPTRHSVVAAAPTLTHPQFMAKGSAVCAVMNRHSRALGPFPQGGAGVAAHYLEKQIAISQTAIAGLQALAPPREDAAQVTALEDQTLGLIGTGNRLVLALRTGDADGARSLLAQVNALTVKTNKAWNAFGLTTCGS